MRFLKPLDEELLHHALKSFSRIITLEDGTITGGLGSAVLEFMADNGHHAQVKRLAVPDRFIEQGKPDELQPPGCGFDKQSIKDTVKMMLR
ncbi:MAG: transketolase C-terminal domain-containing protein [Bacteroidales bacterium]|nr:transketolase C-terminal domain-containing protein [Bacteroidales bacterium]